MRSSASATKEKSKLEGTSVHLLSAVGSLLATIMTAKKVSWLIDSSQIEDIQCLCIYNVPIDPSGRLCSRILLLWSIPKAHADIGIGIVRTTVLQITSNQLCQSKEMCVGSKQRMEQHTPLPPATKKL